MKETTRATYARAYTRPYQKTGTGKLKLNRNLYGTGRSVHRPFNYRSIPVRRPFFLNGRPLYGSNGGTFFLRLLYMNMCTCMMRVVHILYLILYIYIYIYSDQCCIQKMWLGGQTESFHNVGGRRCIRCINFSKVTPVFKKG